MPRAQPSETQLQADSHHLLYEIEQLDWAVKLLAAVESADGADLPAGIANALLESVAVHARGLIEFVYAYPGTARADDIIAADFLPDWPDSRPPMNDFLAEVKRRADKEMMHITRGRSIPEVLRLWEYSVVREQVAQPLRLFVEKVPHELVLGDFHARATAALASEEFPPVVRLALGSSPPVFGATHAGLSDLRSVGDENS